VVTLQFSVQKSCARFLPLALRAPHVSVVHSVNFPTLPYLTAGLLVYGKRFRLWKVVYFRWLGLVLLKTFLGWGTIRDLDWRRRLKYKTDKSRLRSSKGQGHSFICYLKVKVTVSCHLKVKVTISCHLSQGQSFTKTVQ